MNLLSKLKINYLDKLFFYLCAFFLIVFLFFDYYFYILSFKDYSWISFADHDQAYLIEQFLLKINYPFTKMVLSEYLEYGVEFYYLKYFFTTIKNFIFFSKIEIFYIISFFHYIFFFISFLFLVKILKNYNVSNISILFYLLCIISSGYFTRSLSSLKPDSNIFLLCLVLYFFYIDKFINKKKVKNFYISIFFLSLSIAIKFFGIFLIPTLFFIKNILKEKFKNSQENLIKLSYINIFFIFIWGYCTTTYIFLNYYDDLNKYNILIFINKNFLIFFLFSFLLSLFINFMFIRLKVLIFEYIILNLIFFTLFVVSSPFLFDYDIFVRSVLGNIAYTNVAPKYENLSILKNYLDFFSLDIKWNVINYTAFCFFLFFFVYKYFFLNLKFKIPKILNFFSIYILTVYFFMPIFFPGERLYNIRYTLLIFCLTFIFLCLNIFIKKKSYFAILTFFFVILNLYENFSNYNYFYNILNYRNISAKIKIFNIQLSQNENLVSCGGFYPIDKGRDIKVLNEKICLDLLSKKNYKMSDTFIFSKNNTSTKILVELNNLRISNLVDYNEIYIDMVDVYGFNKKKSYIIMKRKA
jgi:hypothetical protein